MKLSDVMQDATTKPVEKRRLLVAQLTRREIIVRDEGQL